MKDASEAHSLGITDEEISRRAYEIWEERGRPETDGQDDWQSAVDQLIIEAKHKQPRGPLLRFFQRIRGRAASY